MARLSAAGEAVAVNAVTAISPDLSLHTADPGTTGVSEVSGGSYARQAETWSSATAGSPSGANTNSVSVPVPPSTTIGYNGHFSAATGGTYSVGAQLSAAISTGASAATVTFAAGADTLSAS